MAEQFDVLVVGAGLSGVGAGHYLQARCPGRSYAILEMRDAIGGTWDLFRYPGIRCDSDMFSLGYPFRPWSREETIASGDAIRDYIRDTAREFGIDRKIRFRHRVRSASWSSAEARWTIVAERTDTSETMEFTANFLISCSGYYDYDQGYTPEFPGRERYRGELIHPQFWSQDIDYTDKSVVVIGSGATAVTLVPAMTDRAARVTMLQRSPSYLLRIDRKDPLNRLLRRVLPQQTAYNVVRWRNTLRFMGFYQFCRSFPEEARKVLMQGVRRYLREGYDVETHFNPRYNPWDERVCFVPDGDFFDAINSGKAEVVTDTIDTFTERGIRLHSGRELEADLVVSATGLNVKILGGMEASVDGEAIVPGEKIFYRGTMFSDVPNFAMVIGYTNATWTLKVDLICRYICRLLNRMDATGTDTVVPRLNDPSVKRRPLIELTSGYLARVKDQFPKNGSKMPWRLHQNYILDRLMLRRAKLEDGSLDFSKSSAEQGREGKPGYREWICRGAIAVAASLLLMLAAGLARHLFGRLSAPTSRR